MRKSASASDAVITPLASTSHRHGAHVAALTAARKANRESEALVLPVLSTSPHASSWHCDVHGSPICHVASPSSHCSPASTAPLPQITGAVDVVTVDVVVVETVVVGGRGTDHAGAIQAAVTVHVARLHPAAASVDARIIGRTREVVVASAVLSEVNATRGLQADVHGTGIGIITRARCPLRGRTYRRDHTSRSCTETGRHRLRCAHTRPYRCRTHLSCRRDRRYKAAPRAN